MCEAHTGSGETHPHADMRENHQVVEHNHDCDGDDLGRPRTDEGELNAPERRPDLTTCC